MSRTSQQHAAGSGMQEMGGDSAEPGKEIMDILYATEEGFAVPEGEEQEDPGF